MLDSDTAVIVTGAAGGIGRAAVQLLEQRGVRVLAVDLECDRTTSAPTTIPHTCDVSREADVREMIREAMTRFGRLDGVFNNAAVIGPIAFIEDYESDAFLKLLATDVFAVWLVMKHAMRALSDSGGGTIVNTASTAGLMGWPRLSGYVAAKHAVIGLTRAVAMESADRSIRVNALCPGPTDTPMLRSIGEGIAEGERAIARQLQERTIPAGRLGAPGEIAACAVWLLLDAPTFLTGATVSIDGGQTAGFGVAMTGSL